MNEFGDLGLAGILLSAIKANSYKTPTPIQQNVIPAALDGKDVIGIAQTGTGKTAAFALPILQSLIGAKKRVQARRCTVLVLAPTRELAAQIDQQFRLLGKDLRPSTSLIVGGAKYPPQIRALTRGCDIVIATPGRLMDHLSNGVLMLDQTTTVVLDEADQMLDLGFLPAIRRLFEQLPEKRQTLLFSATMPPEIRKLTKAFLTSPMEISVSPASRPVETVAQKVLHIDQSSKRKKLAEILGTAEFERSIIFTRTKRGADRVSADLDKAGLMNAAIHGDKSQGQRNRALDAFRRGKVGILVATDVAARGIDIPEVTHVINFELPNMPEAYVHRIGRTARAGRSGVAISFCDKSERPYLRGIEKLTGIRLSEFGDASSHAAPSGEFVPVEQRPSQGREAVNASPDPAKRRKPKKRFKAEQSDHPAIRRKRSRRIPKAA